MSVLGSTQGFGGAVALARPALPSFDLGPTAREAGAWTRMRRRLDGTARATEKPLFPSGSFGSGMVVDQAGALTQLRRSLESAEIALPQIPRLTTPQVSALLSLALVGAAVAKPLPALESSADSVSGVSDRAMGAAVASPSRIAHERAVERAVALRAELPVGSVRAKLVGGQAVLPAGAPEELRKVVAAANNIAGLPYSYGGGHGSFESSGYDCSGAVSYALHGGGMLSSPLDSGALAGWGQPGEGKAITVYANAGHAYAVIAGIRWDTSGTGGSGPNWHQDMRSPAGYVARHPSGY